MINKIKNIFLYLFINKKKELNKNKNNKKYTFIKIREKYKDAYKPWLEKDDENLKLLYKEGKSIEEISVIFKRKYGAIKSRLKKLKLI